MNLTDAELERYARQLVLPQVGGVGQRRLKAARVAIIGAGGIGSAVLPALAGAGIGRLTIIDGDVIDVSNFQRQLIYRNDQQGEPKAAAAARFATALNPDVEVTPIAERIDDSNAAAVLADHDLILDGSDNFMTRLAVNQAAVELRVPLLSAAAAQFQVQLALLRGWEDGQPCYRCFVGDAFDADDCDNCAELGVLGALTGLAGHFAALLAIRSLVGTADDAGKLFLFDGLALSLRTLSLPNDSSCTTCGGGNAPSA